MAAPNPTAQPQIAAAPAAESMQPLLRADSTDGSAGRDAGARPAVAAGADADAAAVADQAMAPLAGDTPPGVTASEAPAGDEATSSTEALSAAEETTDARKAAPDDRSAPEPESQPPDKSVFQIPEGEPGSVAILTSGGKRGTPVIWRVLEGALGALALLFLIGLILKLRASRKPISR